MSKLTAGDLTTMWAALRQNEFPETAERLERHISAQDAEIATLKADNAALLKVAIEASSRQAAERLKADPHPGAALRDEHEALKGLMDALAHEMERTLVHRERKGGMQAPDHGDFASAPPSMLGRMRWWAREMRNALNGEVPGLLRKARNVVLDDVLGAVQKRIRAAHAMRSEMASPEMTTKWAGIAEALDEMSDAVRAMKTPEEP